MWRPGTSANPQSYFYIQRSSDPNPNAIYAQPWGLPTDFPAVGDYDGDGKDDFTVVRRENGKSVWYILPSGGGNFRRIEFGLTTDGVLTDSRNDFNNDGREDLLVARSDSATGNITFFVGDALTGQLILTQQWGNIRAAGQGGTVFVIYGNYLGDSRADVGVYYGACPSNPTCEIGGTWWFKETGSSNYTVTKFGVPLNFQANTGDFPINGDFDGDGKFDITVLRQSNSTYYSLRSSDGQIQTQYWDGNSATPPSSDANLLENPIEPRSKSIPAGALKNLVITKQPDDTFSVKRGADYFRTRE